MQKKISEIQAEAKKIARNCSNLENPTPAERARYERDIQRQRDKLQKLQEEAAK